MKKIKTFKEIEVQPVTIKWSIHLCQKYTKKGKAESVLTQYMTVKKVGRRKETLMHDTLGKALSELGI